MIASRRSTWLSLVALATHLIVLIVVGSGGLAAQRPSDSDGWTLPPTASTETNPVALTPAVLAKGKDLFKSKCQKCHGVTGRGDGPDADPEHSPGDLTDSKRASRNPDGVIFYKVWNGRTKPKMPALKTDLSRDDVWTLVHYVKTLRK